MYSGLDARIGREWAGGKRREGAHDTEDHHENQREKLRFMEGTLERVAEDYPSLLELNFSGDREACCLVLRFSPE